MSSDLSIEIKQHDVITSSSGSIVELETLVTNGAYAPGIHGIEIDNEGAGDVFWKWVEPGGDAPASTAVMNKIAAGFNKVIPCRKTNLSGSLYIQIPVSTKCSILQYQ